jgi:hypothetical protein
MSTFLGLRFLTIHLSPILFTCFKRTRIGFWGLPWGHRDPPRISDLVVSLLHHAHHVGNGQCCEKFCGQDFPSNMTDQWKKHFTPKKCQNFVQDLGLIKRDFWAFFNIFEVCHFLRQSRNLARTKTNHHNQVRLGKVLRVYDILKSAFNFINSNFSFFLLNRSGFNFINVRRAAFGQEDHKSTKKTDT